MRSTATDATGASASATSKAGRFDQVSIALHWLTVALVIAQLTTAGLVLGSGGDRGAAVVLTAHRSLGLITWFVVAARLVWRVGFARPPPFPASLSKLQQRAAKLNEYGLYALLALQPLTGLGDTVFRGRAFAFIVWRIPALVRVNKPVFHTFHALHEAGAVALIGLIGLHAAAALFHGVVRRDGVLERMLPWTTR